MRHLVTSPLHVGGALRRNLDDNVPTGSGKPNLWDNSAKLDAEDGVRQISRTVKLLRDAEDMPESGCKRPTVAVAGREWVRIPEVGFYLEVRNHGRGLATPNILLSRSAVGVLVGI